jgi:hypothetical protein
MNTFCHEDGSEVFIQQDDERMEDALASFWADQWKCKITRFPKLFALDGYCEKHDRIRAWVELRMRTCPSQEYPTVIINLDKFDFIRSVARHFGIPGIFVVGYTDQTGFIDLCEISERSIETLVRRDKNEGRNEFVVHVPTERLHLTAWNSQGDNP